MEQRIGHYKIVSELGRGGMGVVYKAHEESLNRFVAIKVLGQHLAEDQSYVQRFIREAQSAAQVSHPNLVQIYLIGQEQGRHYFVMEYVSGESLQRQLARVKRLEITLAASLIHQVASGLAAAHAHGIIHRDIKPANILITEQGLAKVADFGLAFVREAASRLTATGMFMGTPGYLSPEQCLDQQIDHRSDIFSLGITFFEMLTGVPPFQADSPLALVKKIVEVEPPEVNELAPGVPEPVRMILSRMMAKDRLQRYQSCPDLLHDLDAFLIRAGVHRQQRFVTPPASPISPARSDTTSDTNRQAVLFEHTPTYELAGGAGVAGTSAPVPPPLPRADTTGASSSFRDLPWLVKAGVVLGLGAIGIATLVLALVLLQRGGWVGGSRMAGQQAGVATPTEITRQEPTTDEVSGSVNQQTVAGGPSRALGDVERLQQGSTDAETASHTGYPQPQRETGTSSEGAAPVLSRPTPTGIPQATAPSAMVKGRPPVPPPHPASPTPQQEVVRAQSSIEPPQVPTSSPVARVATHPLTPTPAAPTVTGEEQSLLEQLHSGDAVQMRTAAKIIYRRHLANSDLVDAVNEVVLEQFNQHPRDSIHVDAMAWMLKVLGASKSGKYQSTLEHVQRHASNRKIKGYAEKTLRLLQ